MREVQGDKTHEDLRRAYAALERRFREQGLEFYGRRQDGTEEAAARLVAERLGSAVESIEDAFALFGRDDRLVLCNSAYRRLIGDAISGPIVGVSYETLLEAWSRNIEFPDEKARVLFRALRLERRHHGQESSFDVRMRDGRSLRVVDRPTPEGGSVKTIRDATEDVRLSEELRQARVAAETSNGAKSEFLSSMSHELRTPLNAILGFAELLQRDKKESLSPRQQERVAHILKGGGHLLRLIDDILDLSHIEAGGVSISTEPVSVRELLDEVTETLEPMAERQGISVKVEGLPRETPAVLADRTRFAQILMNFGSNAIKYNRARGTVLFSLSTPRPGFVRVAVRDTGLGIPADKQDKLFQPFQRAGQELGSIEGTGIGLVITRRLARLMNGDVGFWSVPGTGSEFWIDLPSHESKTPPSVPPAAPGSGTQGLVAQGRGLILYVEDNPANVRFMQDLVGTFETVELITAATAEQGVELARSRKPAVVIMDINLPGCSGLEALRKLRDAPETAGIPVIALTAAASELDRSHGLAAGFHGYLTKPVKVVEFVTALEALLLSPA